MEPFAREPYAGHLEAEAMEDQGGIQRTLFRKLQGPVVGMAQAAILLGGQLETDQTGFVVTFNGTFPPLSINGGTNGEWKTKATNAMSQAIVCQLSEWLEVPNVDDHMQDGQCRRKKGKRKGLYGIGGAIDTFATTALIANIAAPLIKSIRR